MLCAAIVCRVKHPSKRTNWTRHVPLFSFAGMVVQVHLTQGFSFPQGRVATSRVPGQIGPALRVGVRARLTFAQEDKDYAAIYKV